MQPAIPARLRRAINRLVGATIGATVRGRRRNSFVCRHFEP